jgi:trehalose/maltose hydrolase-like predicted phosphorylase
MEWFDQNQWEMGDAPDEQAYLGNGVLGWRLSSNPFSDDGRCYVTGFSGQEPPHGVNCLIELPNPLNLKFAFALNAPRTQIEVQSQRLNYMQAALFTSMRVEDPHGNQAQVETRHVAYRNQPSMMGVQVRVVPQQDGEFVMKLNALPPQGHSHIQNVTVSAPGPLKSMAEMKIQWRADDKSSHCAGLMIPVLADDCPEPQCMVESSGCDLPADTLVLRWENLKANQPLVMDWVIAMVSNFYHPYPDLQAGRMVQWGFKAIGMAELFEKHCEEWAKIWLSRPLIDGDDDSQRAVDGSMFHLHSSVHRSSRQSMAPFGLSANGYYGHVFWDCETWTYPPVLLQNPDAALSILEFRLAGLEQAKRTAALFGYDGAMFPWESVIGGAEDTPVWADTGFMEHHIVPDIAYAFWQYQCVTGDQEFLHRGTWPVLQNIARWVVSRVEKTARGYEICHVVPADEFCFNVNNSAHTNMACVMALRVAIQCAKLVGITPPSSWAKVAKHMVIPRDESGLILQQDGWTPAHISKQADTTLAIYPLGMIEDAEEIERVVAGHVRIDPTAACTVAMGDQINAVVCARTGKTEMARMVWDRGWKPFWIEPWGMYAETVRKKPGCFITGCGGLLQAVLMGFPGLQLDRPDVATHPVSLPEGWKSIRCEHLYFKGQPHELVAEKGMKKAKLSAME